VLEKKIVKRKRRYFVIPFSNLIFIKKLSKLGGEGAYKT